MVVFSKIFQQILDAGQLFPSSHVWNERARFCGKML